MDNRIPGSSWSKRSLLLLVLVCLVGAAVRVAYVSRPLDHRIRSPWRQADGLQIARNFHREGMNIFYPRIDWREDTPGFVEMEFPAHSWLGALAFHLTGQSVPVLRGLSLIAGLVGLYLFVLLARSHLPPAGAIFAVAAFALNPLLFHLSTSLQPESFMLALSLLAVYFASKWTLQPERYGLLLAAAAATACAILAKATAAHLGIVLAAAVLNQFGWRAFYNWRVLLAAVVAVAPPLGWYAWAHGFWTTYGMSLGLSNGYPFPTPDMLWPPSFLLGIIKWESMGVFSPFGWLLLASAVLAYRWRVGNMLVWYGSAFLLYLVSASIASEDWAYYYHSIAVAPACLLIGAGFIALLDRKLLPRPGGWLAAKQPLAAWLLASATLLTLVAVSVVYIQRRDNRPELLAMRECALQFAEHVPFESRIVVAGGPKYDRYGRIGANNISMTFAWMDRKGFNYGSDVLSIETLDAIADRGGRYWIVQDQELNAGALREQAADRYRLLASCEFGYELYDLQQR